MKQRVTILGSTGSIGTSTLDVVARHPDRYEIFALSASTQVDLMLAQCARFKPRYVVMASEPHGRILEEKIRENGLEASVLRSEIALQLIASHESVDIVMAAIVGAAGLAPCLAAASGQTPAAGQQGGAGGWRRGVPARGPPGWGHPAADRQRTLGDFPVPAGDSATWADGIDKIILTASGGPFRTRDPATLRDVTPEQACAHPNWVMGRKISVDSATMMNKALEVIEARYLFGYPLNSLRS
jgi:1-deoxy-D-xylulose-5-phosphate reductoisomerase